MELAVPELALVASVVGRDQMAAAIESAQASQLLGKLPRCAIPAALIGRLAVDSRAPCAGRGVGQCLLVDALSRVLRMSDDIGCSRGRRGRQEQGGGALLPEIMAFRRWTPRPGRSGCLSPWRPSKRASLELSSPNELHPDSAHVASLARGWSKWLLPTTFFHWSACAFTLIGLDLAAAQAIIGARNSALISQCGLTQDATLRKHCEFGVRVANTQVGLESVILTLAAVPILLTAAAGAYTFVTKSKAAPRQAAPTAQ